MRPNIFWNWKLRNTLIYIYYFFDNKINFYVWNWRTAILHRKSRRLPSTCVYTVHVNFVKILVNWKKPNTNNGYKYKYYICTWTIFALCKISRQNNLFYLNVPNTRKRKRIIVQNWTWAIDLYKVDFCLRD